MMSCLNANCRNDPEMTPVVELSWIPEGSIPDWIEKLEHGPTICGLNDMADSTAYV